MFLRTDAPNWTNPSLRHRQQQNERTFRRFTNAGRRIFREQPIRRAVVCPRSCSSDCARTLSCWRIREPASIQLFMALCVWIFLHSMRRLLLLLRHHLYSWMDIPRGVEAALDSKRAYLNSQFFVLRAVVFLGFFLLAALALRRFSVLQDKDGNPRFTIGMRKVSFISLPMFALCLTFGAFDWLMSLNYRWFSTMFGVYIFAGAAGSSMSLLVLVITALRLAGYLKGVVTAEHYHIMGKWMLAFCVFWAYIGFGQYMLIWYANLPDETQFFITRNTQSWWALSMLLVIGRFFIAFPILLMRSIKKHPHQLCIVAGWIVLMQMLDIYLIMLPSLHGSGFHPSIWDLLSLIAMGATLGFVYLRLLPRTSLFPVRDPRLIESLQTVN